MTGRKEEDIISGLFAFIEKSPCSYHAAENVMQQLAGEGYSELKERDEWKLVRGGKYYVNRNASSVLAFHIPEKEIRGFHMIATHSDSPSFKIKALPEITVEEQYVKLNVEKYGGMIMSTWLDRPLSVAGRIVASQGKEAAKDDAGELAAKLVSIDKDLLIIPNVAVHMNRDMNKGVEYNAQTDMLPLFGGIEAKESFMSLVAEAAGVNKEEILGCDLYLYNREKGRSFGAQEEYICAPRLDDLECVYTSLQAMLETAPEEHINVLAVFDNEEVGSMTRQGAASTFLQDTLQRICASLSFSQSDYCRLIADSFMISADNAHAVHPNHPEKADPTNRPYLNGGIVIKYHGGQRYTTDAFSAAVMKDICRRAGVPCQSYANRSDIPGGSTLGNVSAAQVPVPTVDIGLAQLAMHSACETAGRKDVEYMLKAMRCFLM